MQYNKQKWQGFDSWQAVMEYAKTGMPLFYHAPLDQWPIPIGTANYRIIVRKRTIRIIPPKGLADPFTADKHHCNRFLIPIE